MSVTLMRASSVMPMPPSPQPGVPACAWTAPPPNSTARAVGLSRVPLQVGQATSPTSSASGSAKVCSRPFWSSAITESSKILRCSLLSLTPVPTQSGHQPCLLL